MGLYLDSQRQLVSKESENKSLKDQIETLESQLEQEKKPRIPIKLDFRSYDHPPENSSAGKVYVSLTEFGSYHCKLKLRHFGSLSIAETWNFDRARPLNTQTWLQEPSGKDYPRLGDTIFVEPTDSTKTEYKGFSWKVQ